jgi:hypothetical protein
MSSAISMSVRAGPPGRRISSPSAMAAIPGTRVAARDGCSPLHRRAHEAHERYGTVVRDHCHVFPVELDLLLQRQEHGFAQQLVRLLHLTASSRRRSSSELTQRGALRPLPRGCQRACLQCRERAETIATIGYAASRLSS